MNKYILLFLLLVSSTTAFSADLKAFETGKNPTKAWMLSAFIPGGGQFYNESYIKGAVVLAGESWAIGAAWYAHQQMWDARNKRDKFAKDSYDYARWQEKANTYYNHRQNAIWWWGATTILSMLDAYVDAHLYNYEEKQKEIDLRFGANSVSLQIRF